MPTVEGPVEHLGLHYLGDIAPDPEAGVYPPDDIAEDINSYDQLLALLAPMVDHIELEMAVKASAHKTAATSAPRSSRRSNLDATRFNLERNPMDPDYENTTLLIKRLPESVNTIKVIYSGSGDEGEFEAITFFDAHDQPIEITTTLRNDFEQLFLSLLDEK